MESAALRPGVRLAFDVGRARIGVARCDQDALLAFPVLTLRRDRYGADLDEAADLVAEHDAVEAVVGLPINLSGAGSSSSRDARRWARELADRIAPVTVRLVDERLTTVSAHRHLHEAGLKERSFRSIVDQAAAVVILEQALHAERSTGRPAGQRVHPSKKGRA
ncbi:Holliday junction resolvase RuvX [Actinomyces slackii]|uniref:Putative pre-16S rRNA nuclease n=1 Tax=Actinomyces slackii TaxID=52774 RepID=A0A3S4SG98_9ACTO|nr:Holliday junction resolvase RuvX [Actinomyces slackii]VEG75318.1 Putative Holliday junction resolvase [Actinomyces slackii]